MLLDVLSKGLSMEGYNCETTLSAFFALELIEEDPFELLITDIEMSEMNGLELLKRAKELRPSMKVIVMTGLIDNSWWNEAKKAGASDFIKKPFAVEQLAAKIKQVMDTGLEKR
jgi:DNA-binding NtrC family response regulator